jgi:hypothetical protein
MMDLNWNNIPPVVKNHLITVRSLARTSYQQEAVRTIEDYLMVLASKVVPDSELPANHELVVVDAAGVK